MLCMKYVIQLLVKKEGSLMSEISTKVYAGCVKDREILINSLSGGTFHHVVRRFS